MQIEAIHELGELFEQVQLQQVFPDGKTFPDCLPKFPLNDIFDNYEKEKNNPSFNLKAFVQENFSLPHDYASDYKADVSQPIKQHIENLWDVLTRKPDNEKSSLIPLPYPYIVPGGRFREIYYWDSYFTILGLQVSRRVDMIQYMADNFSYLIDKLGYIPNGNRQYFEGRSQPPFYALIIQVLREEKGNEILVKYLPQLQKEYDFWMRGSEALDEDNNAINRVVRLPGGCLLNRYWDENDTPRPEAYKEDVELAEHSARKTTEVYRQLRAGAESGWDYSTRWFKDDTFASIGTADIISVDLNCLFYFLEQTLSEAYKFDGNKEQSSKYYIKAAERKEAILKYCWNEEQQFFTDYDFTGQSLKSNITMAGMYPLFFKLATPAQAEKAAATLHTNLLKPGGCATSTEASGQQWDSPNGLAPLNYIGVKGLQYYGMLNLAAEIAKRWIALNVKVFKATGKLMEKYNVVDTNLLAGGGEYPSQDGFGWTNGVLLKLMHEYDSEG